MTAGPAGPEDGRGWAPLEPEDTPSSTRDDRGSTPGTSWSPPQDGWAPPAPPRPPAGNWAPRPWGSQYSQPYAPPYAPPLVKAGSARTGPLPLHPMALGDILDGAFKLFKANARSIILIVAVITVPLQLLTAFIVRDQVSTGWLEIFRDPTVAEASNPGDFGVVGGSFLALFLGALSTTFIAGAVSHVVALSYLGHESTSPAAALKATVRRFPALLVAFFLVHILEGIAFVFCFLPALLPMALFTPVTPAIAIEELGPIKGMRRSWRLVQSRLWPVLGTSLLAGVVSSFLSNIVSAAPVTIGGLFGGPLAWLLLAVGGILAELITAPIVAITATLIYFDLRIRQEGFDLQMMAADLERSAVR